MKSKIVCSLSIVTIALMMVACTPQSESTDSVTTTTATGASVAMSAKEAEKQDKALVRVVNALPDPKSVDTFVGHTREFTNVSYKTVTPYKAVPDVHEQISIRPAGQENGEPFAQNREMISGGNHYTAIVMPETGNKATLRVVGDKLTAPTPGKANVRIIHASPDSTELDVFLKGENNKLFSGVNPQTVTNYNEIEPMTATLEFRPQDRSEVLLTVPNMTFESGHYYTIVVAGKSKDTPKLEAIKIDDKLNVAATRPRFSPSPTATSE